MPRLVIALATLLTLAACAAPSPPGVANANTPGWTGTTVVRGSTSTMADNANATFQQQKWGYSVWH
jgi:hypothetical protein